MVASRDPGVNRLLLSCGPFHNLLSDIGFQVLAQRMRSVMALHLLLEMLDDITIVSLNAEFDGLSDCILYDMTDVWPSSEQEMCIPRKLSLRLGQVQEDSLSLLVVQLIKAINTDIHSIEFLANRL